MKAVNQETGEEIPMDEEETASRPRRRR
jgi:hypothetical protein